MCSFVPWSILTQRLRTTSMLERGHGMLERGHGAQRPWTMSSRMYTQPKLFYADSFLRAADQAEVRGGNSSGGHSEFRQGMGARGSGWWRNKISCVVSIHFLSELRLSKAIFFLPFLHPRSISLNLFPKI